MGLDHINASPSFLYASFSLRREKMLGEVVKIISTKLTRLLYRFQEWKRPTNLRPT